MSWFNSAGFSSLAKSAISQAQKSIDKVLDIKDDAKDAQVRPKSSENTKKPTDVSNSNTRVTQVKKNGE